MKNDLYQVFPQLAKKTLTGLIISFVTLQGYEAAGAIGLNSSREFISPAFKPAIKKKIFNKVAPITVTGRVSSVAGEPLPGVTVLLKGNTVGTTTGSDGRYSLALPESNGTLIFSFIGFITKEVSVNGQSTINVTLNEDNKALEEVVVVGYTSKNQTQLSSSVAVVSEEKLKGVTAPNLGNLLQGKASGIMVSGGSGQPGNAPTVRIRGTGSYTAGADPLYVVDGVIGGTANPNDIESVTVLKDAAATGLYGSRAANGVIVITTKSGKAGKTKINFNSSLGNSWVSSGNFETMNSQEFYDFQRPMWVNDYTGKRSTHINELKKTNPNPTEAQINAYLAGKNFPTTVESYLDANLPASLTQTDTNWKDLAFRNGLTQNYELSASGGNEKTRFYISGNYYKEQGTVTVTDYERFNVRMNLEHKINEKVTVATRLNGRMDYTTFDSPQERPALHQAFRNLPWDAPYNPDGTVRTGQEADWRGRERTNFLFYLPLNYSNERGNNIQGDLMLNYDINDWLSFSTTNRADISSARAELYADPKTPTGSLRKGLLTNNIRYAQSLLNSNLLKAAKNFGNHSLSGILGAEFQTNYGDNLNSQGGGVPSGLEIMDVAAVPVGITGSKYKSAFNSYFSQVDYSYNNKYFGVASFRRDGSSKFGSNNQYGNFYAFGGSWIVSNEDFMPKSGPLSLLKFRASYGTTGNANIADFITRALYSYSTQYAGISAAIPSRLANPNLTWEKAYTTNVGLNIGLFKRIDIAVDAYQRDNKGLLFDVPLSSASGFTSQIQNIGTIRNNGVDIELNTTNIATSDFTWETNFNVGFNRNEVTSLYNDQPIVNGLRRVMVGQPLRTWYMQKWAGVDPQTGGPLWEKLTYDADGKVTQVEKTSNYNLATLQVVGKASPDFTGGFTNNFAYKGLSLNVFFNFVSGNLLYNSDRESMDADGAYPTNGQVKLKNGWTRWEKPGDVATHPFPILGGGGTNSNKPSSRFLEDGSYIRLRNIRLNYEIPATWIQKLSFSNLNVFVSADNLHTWTKYSGLDPEVNFDNGILDTPYPLSKKVLFGINLGL
ncbi:SusC/RagA family TonB-linked outer membrane protein [Adhaeribacter aerolatus]|uniref:SusC/RagA family TonB-linked outer membrane protein n=1 Tax=Adhaeribacter aerolatus TaxID=670289 RepID=A0A512B3W8_9BACT|nr:TonB-dependent receptor [Adhaeribacter aerolatus]GEO06487.1 SusC/RagA family TonB-linked outer membrane protein [Adhaeribacter aerolatus]